MTWVLVSGRELNCGVSERTLTKLSGLGKLCQGLSLWQIIDLCRMMPGALVKDPSLDGIYWTNT